MTLQSLLHLQTNRDGVIHRRAFLRRVGAGTAAVGAFGWMDAVALSADEMRKNEMACILLFMRGGPSQLETFDPKPGTNNGGPTKAISTAANGIQIAENWKNVASAMKDIALVRSMTNREGEHQRATYQLHTGYVPMGSVKFPSFGSIVASEIGPKEFDLPHFVSIGNRATTIGSGFLGMQYAPFVVGNPNQMPTNVALPRGVTDKRLARRLGLLDDLEKDFSEAGGERQVQEHRTLLGSAAQLVTSPRLEAFDLAKENQAVRDKYGRTNFGQGCLLARRLIEQGVTFVEVESNGWDTHQDNFNRTKTLTETVDPAFAALVNDLKERGRLQKTLVIWMGEFGRTPRINPNTGRDHFPRAFNVALAGGGVKGGQVIGATSADGMDVKERPVKVADLFCTFCQALKINPRKENVSSLGRPIKIVDGGQMVKELFA
ncbi:MAG TPA: DUF1501 domain-containing protein [Gemmataceae bacterium]|nr:DUF1501 domain-containing protein [Gemmataceae bacterium]